MDNITIINSPPCISVYHKGERMFDLSCAEANIDIEQDSWYISRVLVAQSFRGKGIGSKVLQILLNEIKKAGGKKVIVTPGGYDNNKEQQFNFYLKNGFTHSIESKDVLVYHYENNENTYTKDK